MGWWLAGLFSLVSFLPDVAENAGRYGKERLTGRRGGVGRVWWSDGARDAGVG